VNSDDVFHVIGFTSQDVLSGSHMHLMKRLGTSAPSSEAKLVEVYFLDPFIATDAAAYRLYGDYLSVYFYSDLALALSRDYGLALPPVIAKVTRAELPVGIGTSIRMPFPANSARRKAASD
jgi:hypothetical protein